MAALVGNEYALVITTPPRTNKEFKEDVAALVGNEYALVGDYVNSRERVTLYHKKCAKTFTVAPVDFFQGTRCPYCTENKYMREEDFKQLVHDISLGGYEASAAPMTKECIITNTIIGKAIKMSRSMVLQELRRPTPSTKLPLDEKGEYEFLNRRTRLKNYIEENYAHGKIIFTEDLRDVFDWDNPDKYPRELADEG